MHKSTTIQARAIVTTPPQAVGARPPGHGGGTRAIHPSRARYCGPATRRPASARDPRRSAPHLRGCGKGREETQVIIFPRPAEQHLAAGWMRVAIAEDGWSTA